MTPINHDNHSHDADQPVVCVCGEDITDADKHRCLPIGWTDHLHATTRTDDQETK